MDKIILLVIGLVVGLLLFKQEAPPGKRPIDPVKWMQSKHPFITDEVAAEIWNAVQNTTTNMFEQALLLSLAFEESSWRPNAEGDGGVSRGLYQMGQQALEDVKLWDPNFPVDFDRLFDVEYATRAAYGYYRVNLKPGRANGDVIKAITMHNVGPSRTDLINARLWWGKQVVERAWQWHDEWRW